MNSNCSAKTKKRGGRAELQKALRSAAHNLTSDARAKLLAELKAMRKKD